MPLLAAASVACSRGQATTPSPPVSSTVAPTRTPSPTLTAAQADAAGDQLNRLALTADDLPGFQEQVANVVPDNESPDPAADQGCGRVMGWQQQFVRLDNGAPLPGLFDVGLTITMYASADGAAECHGHLLDRLQDDDATSITLRTVALGLPLSLTDAPVIEERDYPGAGDDVLGVRASGRGDYRDQGAKDLSIDMVAFRRGRISVLLSAFTFDTDASAALQALVQRESERVKAELGQ